MAAKKSNAAAAAAVAAAEAADSLKKRKRDKAEEAAGRTKKRKPQNGDESKETTTATTTTMTPTKKTKSTKKNDTPRTDVVVAPSAALAPPAAPAATSTWRLSEPMGGCMANIDPVFTADEAHLILCYNTSLQVYATSDSLLERRIPLPIDLGRPQSRVVAVMLSPTTPSFVWAGCADGTLFRVDWTTGAVETMRRQADNKENPPLAAMAVEAVRFASGVREVLYLSEGVPNGGPGAWRVAAYDAATLAQKPGRTLFTAPAVTTTTTKTTTTTTAPLDLLRTTRGGRFVVGARGATVFVGMLTTAAKGAHSEQLAYQFYALDAPDAVACLDVLATAGKQSDEAVTGGSPVLDLVIGCVRGAIYVYGDVANRLRSTTEKATRKKTTAVQPRKHHWHRRSVRTVKWSRDGHYFVSGGPETVLVLWQTDTGRLDFLPHLSASIENVVVSPHGASYAVHLDDNSAMVLSTAEMQPTFHVAGLQGVTLASLTTGPARDAVVRRTWPSAAAADAMLLQRPVPAVVHPLDASRLLLRVGSGGQTNSISDSNLPSASLLQTFDLAAFRSVARQPLARTNPTDNNMTLRGHPLTEPAITQLCASRDGRWLASVDEWQPPVRDISGLAGASAAAAGAWARSRREVHLKFWAVGDDNSSYELVSRIDDAHPASSILGVAADPRHANRFATLGDDGVLRVWGIQTRVRDGLVARDDRGRPLVSWHCLREVPLGQKPGAEGSSGALAFSEDGSTVFAALGAPNASDAATDAVLYAVDADAGTVRTTLHGLFRGAVRGVAVLGAALVLLSADLRVYDLVADALRYGVRLVATGDVGAAESDLMAAAALTQLAVDRHAQAFVVAVPYRVRKAATHAAAPVTATAATSASRLLVFSPDWAQPLAAHELPTLVVALLPSVSRAGFVALDAAAQAWSLADAADTATLGQSLAALDLLVGNEKAEEEPKEEAEEVEDVEDEEAVDDNDDEMKVDNDIDDNADNDDDDDHMAVVIPQQKLHDIFEAAPVSAAPSIEVLFWQVSGLLTGKA